MTKYQNILSLLILLLLGNSSVMAGPSPDKGTAVIYSAEENDAQSTHPFDHPNLFNIYLQAESVGSFLSIVPVPYASSDERDDMPGNRLVESLVQNKVAIWLRIYTFINRRPANLKLIFPFHTFS